MINTTRTKILLALTFCALSAPAGAHRTWLLPSATIVESKEPWVIIDAAVSENLFDFDTTALKLDGVNVTDPDGQQSVPQDIVIGKLRSSLDLKLSKPGTYKIGLVNKSVMATYKLGGELKRWRGSEQAFATEIPTGVEDLHAVHQFARIETYVTALKPNNTALKTSGAGLEMLPLTHPNDLRAGEKAQWRFLLDGKPLANFAFSLVPGGVRYRGVLNEMRLTTDAKGEAEITLPEAGMYWLNASYPAVKAKDSSGQADGAEVPTSSNRFSYAATLEILPQ